MNSFKFLVVLTLFILMSTQSLSAQNWRTRPFTSKNSNEWINKPYTAKIFDRRRYSPLELKNNTQNLRRYIDEWKKNPINRKNYSTYWHKKSRQDRLLNWRNAPYKWHKDKSYYNPLNWRYSESLMYVIEWSNDNQEDEPNPASQKSKEWTDQGRQDAPNNTVGNQKGATERSYSKPHIETIESKNNSPGVFLKEAAPEHARQANTIVVYGPAEVGDSKQRQAEHRLTSNKMATIAVYGLDVD